MTARWTINSSIL